MFLLQSCVAVSRSVSGIREPGGDEIALLRVVGGQTTWPWTSTPGIPLKSMPMCHSCTHCVLGLPWFAGAPGNTWLFPSIVSSI